MAIVFCDYVCIFLVSKYLLSTYDLPVSVLNAKDVSIIKTKTAPALKELTISGSKTVYQRRLKSEGREYSGEGN